MQGFAIFVVKKAGFDALVYVSNWPQDDHGIYHETNARLGAGAEQVVALKRGAKKCRRGSGPFGSAPRRRFGDYAHASEVAGEEISCAGPTVSATQSVERTRLTYCAGPYVAAN